MKTFRREQNTPCGSRQVSISNAKSVISCFDIKIDSRGSAFIDALALIAALEQKCDYKALKQGMM